MPGPMNRIQTEKVKDFKVTLKRFVALLGPHKFTFALSFVCAFIGVYASALAPKYLGYVITNIVSGMKNHRIDTALVYRFLTIMLILYITTPVFRFLQHFIIAGVSGRVVSDLRSSLNAKLDRLPLKYFDGTTQGDIMSRLTNDIDRIDESLQEGISQSVISVFTLLCLFVMMLSTDVVLTLVCIITVPLMLLSVSYIIRFSQKFFVKNQKFLGELDGHVEEVYGGHSVIKAFNREDEAISDFDEINGRLYESGWKSNFYGAMSFPVTGFWGNLGFIFVTVAGALRAVKGFITVGEIQAFVQYVRRFNMPIQEVANFSNMFQSTLAAAERIFEVLSEPEEEDDGAESSVPARGEIEFRDVSFSYTENKPLISGFNLKIPSGTKVAIVGPTGAGKTTVVNLLMRFYDVSSGEILVDGININRWPRDVLRNEFGMVLQDTWLFKGTIAENIAYGAGDNDVSEERISECAKSACADHFINALPGGYRFEINEEGSNISQGEKQLITIARAFMSEPRILILDEATSNVDTRTEALVQRAMENLMAGRTSFIIAHRLSTIKEADIILVMNKGNIVEKGTHTELLKKGGFYSDLYYSQFSGKEM